MAAVLADPDGDAPRRAFGDWHKAHRYPEGDPDRGELVDVQLALAQAMRDQEFSATWVPLYRRAEALLAKAGDLWRVPLVPFEDAHIIERSNPGRFAYDFRRGFVEHVVMSARAFAEHAGELYAVAPIRFATLTGVAEHPEALASPHLARIAGLVMILQEVDDAAIAAIAASPHARRLRWLSIASNRVTMRGIEAICASPHLRGLLFCDCKGNGFPNPVDEFSYEGEAIIETWKTDLGKSLEARFGIQPWLHAPWYFGVGFPPDFEAAADAAPASATEYASV